MESETELPHHSQYVPRLLRSRDRMLDRLVSSGVLPNEREWDGYLRLQSILVSFHDFRAPRFSKVFFGAESSLEERKK